MQQGIACYPDSADLLYELGIFYENTKRHALAEQLMQKLISKHPDHVKALNFLGYSWADNNIHLNLAYSYIKKANRLNPNNAHILDSLGWILYRLGKFRQADKTLKQALLLLPDHHLILEHLGDVNLALENLQAARSYYNQAYLYAETTVDKKRIEEKLEKIK